MAAQAPSTPVTACGQVLGAPGEYHLTGNLGPCGGNGLVITASDVHLSLAGFTVSGMGCDVELPSGIFVNGPEASNVHVEGGTVTGFTFGIVLLASNSRVSGVTVTDNCGYGIVVVGSIDVIDTSVVKGNEVGGIFLVHGSNITVHSNEISGNDDCGVCVESNASTIRSNIVKNNHSTGILIAGSGNAIQGNVAIGNFDGISLLDGSNWTRLRDNTANANANAGIAVAAGSRLNRFIGNRARANGIVDLSDGNAGCDTNWWRRNIFATDSVAGVSDGGPGTGCVK